jgi:hypothetical protein
MCALPLISGADLLWSFNAKTMNGALVLSVTNKHLYRSLICPCVDRSTSPCSAKRMSAKDVRI